MMADISQIVSPLKLSIFILRLFVLNLYVSIIIEKTKEFVAL